MNDAAYPWCLLVPEIAGAKELHELSSEQYDSLFASSRLLAGVMMQLFSGFKMNVAALGNVVPQLHIHHIVRQKADQAWPGPVWGRFPAQPYGESEKLELISKLAERLDAAR
jgi:diadenosine tetraphosphate (Ap4A) HIT family hydrolase